jgi:hypothetical protein
MAALGTSSHAANRLATNDVAAAVSSDPRRPRSGLYGTGDAAQRHPAPFDEAPPRHRARGPGSEQGEHGAVRRISVPRAPDGSKHRQRLHRRARRDRRRDRAVPLHAVDALPHADRAREAAAARAVQEQHQLVTDVIARQAGHPQERAVRQRRRHADLLDHEPRPDGALETLRDVEGDPRRRNAVGVTSGCHLGDRTVHDAVGARDDVVERERQRIHRRRRRAERQDEHER